MENYAFLIRAYQTSSPMFGDTKSQAFSVFDKEIAETSYRKVETRNAKQERNTTTMDSLRDDKCSSDSGKAGGHVAA